MRKQNITLDTNGMAQKETIKVYISLYIYYNQF